MIGRFPLIAPLAALALSGCTTPGNVSLVEADGSTRASLARIAALDDAGPRINAVIVQDPDAAAKSAALAETGPLRGRAVLVKDNIETREWPTTAGSLALAGNRTGRDAPLVARMRAAGGVVRGRRDGHFREFSHGDYQINEKGSDEQRGRVRLDGGHGLARHA